MRVTSVAGSYSISPCQPPLGERFREGAFSNLTTKNIRTILDENPVGQPELPAPKRVFPKSQTCIRLDV